ncbi:hypothetical protein ACSBR2_006480 [Camellia fascicularis]
MDEIRSETDKMDEIMLPGFRFHPTDEELVGFYLKRKVQQRPLSVEVIKQLDIYKHDPWDLPKLATTGEKEWYFYCPRDRKYRNSTRPNRVTGAGFWKATGTDRAIYSSEGSKCIGLKKSLVFYKGRAAKGIKTDWMMHEFRLPSPLTDSTPQKRFMDKNIPANDSWAICRIFKKINTTAQRAISHSWVSPPPPLPQTTSSETFTQLAPPHNTHHFTSATMSFTPKPTSLSSIQFSTNNDLQHSSINTSFSPLDVLLKDLPTSYSFSSLIDTSLGHSKSTVDSSSMFLNMSSSTSIFGDFDGLQEQCNGFSPQEMEANPGYGEETALMKDSNGAYFDDDQWETMKSIGIPFNLPLNMLESDAWKSNLLWDSFPSLSEMSTSYSTNNKCNT